MFEICDLSISISQFISASVVNFMHMTDLKLTQEEQFILNCLRFEFGRGDDNPLSAIALQSMNWDTVYKKSVEWKIAPMLYKIIKTLIKSPLKKGKSMEIILIYGCCHRRENDTRRPRRNS